MSCARPAIKTSIPAFLFVSLLVFMLVLVGLFSRQANAQGAESGAHQNPVALRFYLITVDVGSNVWDNFGHSALRVVDELSGSDTVYNWGVFEVRDGPVAFAYDFFIDDLQYRLATQRLEREVANYRAQRRSVWQDELNLTAAQKQRLLARLQWNRAAENVYYDYDYFFDNCTTRIRDYLNEALDGKLAQVASSSTSLSFRDEVRSHYASIAPIRFALDVLMNGNIDREMSAWESLFLPLRLRSLLEVTESDVVSGGVRLPLVAASQTLLEYPAPAAQPDLVVLVGIALLGLALFLMLMLTRQRRSYSATHARLTFRANAFCLRLLGLSSVVMGLLSGVFGLLMLASWFASGHTDLHHNLNLLVFWPTDLLVVVVALRWLLVASPWMLTHNSNPFVAYYLLLKTLCALVYCAIAWSGLAQQDTFALASYLVSPTLLLVLLGWIVGCQTSRRAEIIL
jgi:hypothetical membrane protein